MTPFWNFCGILLNVYVNWGINDIFKKVNLPTHKRCLSLNLLVFLNKTSFLIYVLRLYFRHTGRDAVFVCPVTRSPGLSLVNICHYTRSQKFFLAMMTLKIYSVSHFPICSTVLITVAVLYVPSPWLIPRGLYLLTLFTHFACPPFPASGSCQNTQWPWGCMYLFELVLLLSLDKYLQVESLDPRVALFLIVLGASILFFTVVTPVYIPSRAQGFLVLHILANTRYFLSYQRPTRCEVTAHGGLDLHFPAECCRASFHAPVGHL